MKHIKPIYEFMDFDLGINLSNINFEKEKEVDPKTTALINIAKEGRLYKYLESGQHKLTFGMLKDLHKEAIEFKEKREYKQGIHKFLFRAVPIALAPVFFPVWFISQILGSTRALNKILVPVLKMNDDKYGDFIQNLVLKVADATEGEFERLMVDDWFYKSFAIERGLILMVKKEHVVHFAYYLSKKMEYMSNDSIVPPYYVENEFRTYMNKKFELNPQLSLKNYKSRPRELDPNEKRMRGLK